MAYRYKYLLFPLIIFIVSLALRLYQLPQRFVYTADEEYQSTYARTIVEDFHPVWIGVSAGDTGFYLGPYFTYFTALWLVVGRGDPLVAGYVSSILGAITTVILYYLARGIAGSKVGFFASIFYAFSPLMVYFDQRYWNPSPIPLLVCLLLLALIMLKNNKWWLLIVSICLGAFWHTHLSLIPLYLLAVGVIWQYRAKVTLLSWIISGLLFFVMLLPLVIFDYNHAWSNIFTPFRLANNGNRSLDIPSHVTKLGETLSRFVYLSPGLTNDGELRNSCATGSTVPSNSMILLTALPLLIYLLRRESWNNPNSRVLSVAIVLLSLSFIFYPGPISAYYALGLVPLYFTVLAIMLKKLNWPVLLIFVLLSVSTLLATDNSYGLTNKRELISEVMGVVQSDSFTLIETGDCHMYAGWRFLFLSYGRAPSTSNADSPLGWLYPSEIGDVGKYTVYVGATNESKAPPNSIAVIERGGYTSYIIESK